MNCREFQKYVGAFADGELDTQASLTALDHLKMCPDCTQRVTQVHELKKSLQRVYGGQSAPADAADRIRAAIGAGRNRWIRLMVPMSMAAAILLTTSFWYFWPRRADLRPVQGRWAADVRQVHRACAAYGLKHHDPSLPRELGAISEKLTMRLGFQVIAPDFISGGFELVGAEQCGLPGHQGGHVLYRNKNTSEWLSVFSVQPIEELRHAVQRHRKPQAVCFAGPDGNSLYAWTSPQASYVICARLSEADMWQLGDPVRQTLQTAQH